MNVSSLLDELDEMIDSAWNMPLSGGKALVDAERVREIVDKIRSSLPQEIRQAKAIVSDRSQIIADAKREAETVGTATTMTIITASAPVNRAKAA